METQMKRKQLPQTDSVQELAQFWDAHDLTDFEEALEEVSEPVFEHVITLPLKPDEAKALREMAQSRGMPATELIRGWIMERIHTS
jgi:hypothetical protein